MADMGTHTHPAHDRTGISLGALINELPNWRGSFDLTRIVLEYSDGLGLNFHKAYMHGRGKGRGGVTSLQEFSI